MASNHELFVQKILHCRCTGDTGSFLNYAQKINYNKTTVWIIWRSAECITKLLMKYGSLKFRKSVPRNIEVVQVKIDLPKFHRCIVYITIK